jgi:hypothetical protein
MKRRRGPRKTWVVCVVGPSGEKMLKEVLVSLVSTSLHRMRRTSFYLTSRNQLGVVVGVGIEKREIACGVINERIWGM